MADDELLEWTVSDAPADTQQWPVPAPPPRMRPPAPHRRWELPRRAWVMLAAAGLSAVLVTAFGLPWLEAVRTRRAVEQVIALEMEAIERGDWDTLETYYDPAARGWVSNEIDTLKQGGVPLLLRPLPIWPVQAGEVRWVRWLEPELAQAQIARSYVVGDGSQVNLAGPQFYRYTEGAWLHAPPPETWWGAPQAWHGAYVDIDYRAVDEAYAAELGHYLDGLLARACAEWLSCGTARVPIEIVTSTGGANPNLWGWSRSNSLAFSLLTSGATRPGAAVPVAVPSPHIAGHPQDEASRTATQRPIAVRVLLRMADERALENRGQGDIFFYALLARQMAGLALEPPELAALRLANPLFSPEQLWSITAMDYSADPALIEALVILNQLLDGQPPSTETALLHTVHTTPDLATWLADGLGWSAAEVETRVAAALNPPVPLVISGQHSAAMALSCGDGIWLADGQGQSWPLLDGLHPYANVYDWSPDGQRLLVSIAGRPAVVDLAAGTGAWLPQPMAEFGTAPQWVNDTVVAYETVTMQVSVGGSSQYWLSGEGIHFYDTANPNRMLEPLAGLSGYQLSPDRTLAVAVLPTTQMHIVTLPALEGDFTPIGNGTDPRWSPDGRQLAFVIRNNSGKTWSLHLAQAATGDATSILSSQDARVPPPIDAQYAWVNYDWSPQGDQLVVAMQAADGFSQEGWVGLLSADSLDFRIVPPPEPGLSLTGARYSADGRTLAVTMGTSFWNRRTRLYDLGSQQWLPALAAGTGLGWSDRGHELVVMAETGTYLAADAADLSAPRLRLTTESCHTVKWRPGPR